MTPKKAIIIVLVLFLIMIMAFTFLYWKKQLAGPESELINVGAGIGRNGQAGLTDQEKLSPVQQKIKAIETKTKEQVEQIVEQGKTATGGITLDAQKKIDEAVNQEIIEKMKLRTPEQLKADQQRRAEQAERDRLINQQIKSQLQNK